MFIGEKLGRRSGALRQRRSSERGRLPGGVLLSIAGLRAVIPAPAPQASRFRLLDGAQGRFGSLGWLFVGGWPSALAGVIGCFRPMCGAPKTPRILGQRPGMSTRVGRRVICKKQTIGSAPTRKIPCELLLHRAFSSEFQFLASSSCAKGGTLNRPCNELIHCKIKHFHLSGRNVPSRPPMHNFFGTVWLLPSSIQLRTASFRPLKCKPPRDVPFFSFLPPVKRQFGALSAAAFATFRPCLP